MAFSTSTVIVKIHGKQRFLKLLPFFTDFSDFLGRLQPSKGMLPSLLTPQRASEGLIDKAQGYLTLLRAASRTVHFSWLAARLRSEVGNKVTERVTGVTRNLLCGAAVDTESMALQVNKVSRLRRKHIYRRHSSRPCGISGRIRFHVYPGCRLGCHAVLLAASTRRTARRTALLVHSVACRKARRDKIPGVTSVNISSQNNPQNVAPKAACNQADTAY